MAYPHLFQAENITELKADRETEKEDKSSIFAVVKDVADVIAASNTEIHANANETLAHQTDEKPKADSIHKENKKSWMHLNELFRKKNSS